MEFPRLLVVATMLAGLLATPAMAQSPYFISANLTFTSVTCDEYGAYGEVEGTQTIDLPDTSDNVFISHVVNGGAPVEALQSLPGPFPQTLDIPAGTSATESLPSPTTPPWTSVQTGFPAVNGTATGIGVQITSTCAADGSGTITLQSGIPAAVPTAVPTLPTAGLALLALLISSVVGLTRRRR